MVVTMVSGAKLPPPQEAEESNRGVSSLGFAHPACWALALVPTLRLPEDRWLGRAGGFWASTLPT